MITFTDRAASELKARIREALELRGDFDHARARSTRPGSRPSTASARASCARTPSPRGSTRSSRVTDDVGARILQSEAFDSALERFLLERRPRRITAARPARRLLAPARCASCCSEAYERLRSAGRPLELVPARRGGHATRPPTPCGSPPVSARRTRRPGWSRFSTRGPDASEPARPEPLQGDEGRGVRGFEQARRDLEEAARDTAAIADLAQLDVLLKEFARAYQELKDRRSLVDFNDLELRAAELLERSPELASRVPRAVRRGDGRRVPGHQPAAGGADRPDRRRPPVPRRRRVPEHLPVPPRRRRRLPRAARERR